MTNYTKKILYGIISLIIISLIVGFDTDSKDYWSNFWNFWPNILGAIVAIILFINQLQIDKKVNKDAIEQQHKSEDIQRYLDFQDSMITKIAKLLLDFNDGLRDNETRQKKQLSTSLVTLLYAIQDGEKRREKIQPLIDDDDSQFLDFQDASTQINSIIADPKNEDIINIVKTSYPDLNNIIIKRKKEIEKIKNQSQNNEIVLGNWIINESSAKNAKYLIGVSTIDKRILGVFKATDSSKIERVNNDGINRIHFEGMEPVKSVTMDNKNNMVMPMLEDWTSRNPILYYKKYLEVNEHTLSKEQIEAISTEMDLKPKEFNSLGNRDIIVVRTNELG